MAEFYVGWKHRESADHSLAVGAAGTSIANIMLANNICDYETDISNHRYTLTFYIGKPVAVRLYAWLYYGAFAATTLSVLFGIYPVWMLFIWAIFPIVQRNINRFKAKQDKATTFDLAIKKPDSLPWVGDHPVDRVSDPEMITIRNGAPADEFFPMRRK